MLSFKEVFWSGVIVFCLTFSKAHALSYSAAPKSNLPASNYLHRIAIIGRDDRKPVPKTYYDIASGIGILFQSGIRSWGCTAFCVAPNIVATNAHCLLRKNVDLSQVNFYLPAISEVLNLTENGTLNTEVDDNPSYRSFFNSTPNIEETEKKFSGRPIGQWKEKSFQIVTPNVHTHYEARLSQLLIVDPQKPLVSFFTGNYSGSRYFQKQSKDWTFAKLKQSSCQNRTLQFTQTSFANLKKAVRQKRVFMIGFHGDSQMKVRILSSNCGVRTYGNRKYFRTSHRRFLQRSGTLLPHTCDGVKGSSGSPIFISTNEGPRVVGINLGTFRSERYRVKKNRITGKIIGKRKLLYRRETNFAVLAQAFLSGLERYGNETLLSDLESFKEVQALLKKLGFYKGPIDGVLGRGTRAAIESYERKNKLVPLATPTQQLLLRLRKDVEREDVKKP